MANCSNLFFLSTLACKLAEVLSDKELAVLSANLVVLSDMLASYAIPYHQKTLPFLKKF